MKSLLIIIFLFVVFDLSMISAENAAVENTFNCIETASFLIREDPEKGLTLLKSCDDSQKKLELLIEVYYRLKKFDELGNTWKEYYLKTNKKPALLASFYKYLSCGFDSLRWDKCMTASFSRLKGVDPNNPFVYYYYALYVLKDPSVLDLKIISKEPFIKNNWNCNAAKKNIVEALKLDKTGLLKIPKSYTEQCGEWMSPK